MKNQSAVYIGCASAFWGDTPESTRQLLKASQLDYIVYDYLSEVTMSLLAKHKSKDASGGYIPDFLADVIYPHLPELLQRKIKLVCNAGAMNPEGLRLKILEHAQQKGLQVRVFCVSGDDLIASKKLNKTVNDLQGHTHETAKFVSANAYLGGFPIAEALTQGADIVITGRIVDSALVVGPLLKEFSESPLDYDWLAQASLAGHLIECGTQCSGGNFTDWQQVPSPENVGFPIIRFFANGEFDVLKAPHSGGLVSFATVAEQLVYEIGDPHHYLLPDVNCDFTSVELQESEPNQVRVRGARGHAPTKHYKVCATSIEGFKLAATIYMGGGFVSSRARSIGQTLQLRSKNILKEKGLSDFSEVRQDLVGDSSHSVLRLAAAHPQREALEILAKEIAPVATSLAPGVASLFGGRPQPTPRVRLTSFLIEKDLVSVQITEGSKTYTETTRHVQPSPLQSVKKQTMAKPSKHIKTMSVPLVTIAYARSGDKGNDVNIGVIARKPEFFPLLKEVLTAEIVAEHFKFDFDHQPSHDVHLWELPGIGALNFLLKDCLSGGGAFSLLLDPQGKTFAQRLLALQVSVPEEFL